MGRDSRYFPVSSSSFFFFVIASRCGCLLWCLHDVFQDFMMQQTMLRVKDPVKSLDFYTRILGMTWVGEQASERRQKWICWLKRGVFPLVPGSSRSLTSPPCASLSTFWATRTKRRFPWRWRTGPPGPFPGEPPLSWRSKSTQLRGAVKRGFPLLDLSGSHPFRLSATGAPSLMRTSRITMETPIREASVGWLLFYRWIMTNVHFIIKYHGCYGVVFRSYSGFLVFIHEL